MGPGGGGLRAMPTLLVQTNVKRAQVQARGNFLQAASGRVAALLGKPEAVRRPPALAARRPPCAAPGAGGRGAADGSPRARSQYVMVSLDADRPMSFGGSEDPCAFVQLLSLGNVGGEANRAISAGVAELCEDGLGVSPDRCYLHVVDVPRSDFGFKGDTFA